MSALLEPKPTVRAPARPPSASEAFARDVVSVIGLPFDVVDLAGAVAALRAAAFENRRCFVSTPNLNFAIAAMRDAAFRRSVLRSDLSLADGAPIVRIARLLGLPIRERIAGATVFEALRRHSGPPLDVYFFGGAPGAAARASQRLNAGSTGLRCVGHEAGGFGAVETLGDAGTIDRINASGAHFVVVALGARKGQAWIERHADRLAAPLLCHLGAVVNFTADTLRRAPRWMQSADLEWLWRIKEEPALFRRYAGDGAAALALLATHVLPLRAAASPRRAPPTLRIEHRPPAGMTLHLGGAWTRGGLDALRGALAAAEERGAAVVVRLDGVDAIDASCIALLQLAAGRWGSDRLVLEGVPPAVERTLRLAMAVDLMREGGR